MTTISPTTAPRTFSDTTQFVPQNLPQTNPALHAALTGPMPTIAVPIAQETGITPQGTIAVGALRRAGPAPIPQSFASTDALAVLAALVGAALLAGALWRGSRWFSASGSRSRWAGNLAAGGWVEPKDEAIAGPLRQSPEYLSAMVAQLDTRVRELEGRERRSAAPRVTTAGLPVRAEAGTYAASLEAKPTHDRRSTLHNGVYALADQGLSPVEIAQRLGKHTGQIELILNLRRAFAQR